MCYTVIGGGVYIFKRMSTVMFHLENIQVLMMFKHILILCSGWHFNRIVGTCIPFQRCFIPPKHHHLSERWHSQQRGTFNSRAFNTNYTHPNVCLSWNYYFLFIRFSRCSAKVLLSLLQSMGFSVGMEYLIMLKPHGTKCIFLVADWGTNDLLWTFPSFRRQCLPWFEFLRFCDWALNLDFMADPTCYI